MRVRLDLAPAAWPHPARAGVLTLLVLAVAAVLWFYVFPWAALHLPIDASGFSG
jgi:hypothetical protein